MLKDMFRVLKEGTPDKTEFRLSGFCISMAARVGTGNITGIAIAIALGGPGAIFGCGSSPSSVRRQALSKARWRKFINKG
ncbi:alanine:cation symporter family protein [Bacillus licheniformis]|nr:alanine:cation symporter family protein [Bacillus licheniformis]